MKTFKKLSALAIFVFLAIFTTGCGYRMGSMMHPQIKTIAIADVKNDTKEPLLTEIMRGQLAEQIMTDGSLKLVSKEEADCVLYCHIRNISQINTRDDSDDGQDTYRPSEFSITVIGSFVVKIPGRSGDLIPMRNISGTARYQYESDPQLAKFSGLKQACLNFARFAVQYTTEAW